MIELQLEIERDEEFTLLEEQEPTFELEQDNNPYQSWERIVRKPFETLGDDFNVIEGELQIEKTNEPIQNSTKLFTSDGAFLLKQQIELKVPIDTRLTNSQIDEIFN